MKFKSILVLTALSLALIFTGCVPTETPNTPEDDTADDSDTTDTSDDIASTVKVYFGNTVQNPNTEDCNLVYEVTRNVETSNAQTALTEMLKGPTDAEESNGFTAFFNAQTADDLNNVQIFDDTAFINLKSEMQTEIPNASSSCGSSQLIASFKKTMEQFGVTKVYFNFDEDAKKFYEWLQLSCPSEYARCSDIQP